MTHWCAYVSESADRLLLLPRSCTVKSIRLIKDNQYPMGSSKTAKNPASFVLLLLLGKLWLTGKVDFTLAYIQQSEEVADEVLWEGLATASHKEYQHLLQSEKGFAISQSWTHVCRPTATRDEALFCLLLHPGILLILEFLNKLSWLLTPHCAGELIIFNSSALKCTGSYTMKDRIGC